MRRNLLLVVFFLAAALVLRDAHAAPRDTLTVLVVAAETGKPIASAEVRGSAATARGMVSWSETTDARGMAKLEAIEVKRLSLRVTAMGYVGVQRPSLVVGDAEQPLRVELAPGVAFKGRVLDASGKPVHRAHVEVVAGGVHEGVREAKPDGPSFAEVWTDERGTFRVPGIPPDAIATVLVRARGWTQGRVAVRPEKGRVGPKPLEIRLEPGARVRGRVVDAAGKVVMGARVVVIAEGSASLKADPRGASPGSAAEQTYLDMRPTDRKGRFAIDGLVLGRSYLARAYGENGQVSAWVGPFSAERAGQKVTLGLTLAAGPAEDAGDAGEDEGTKASIAKLVATIDDQDVEGRARMEAAQALGKIRPGGIAALAALLKRSNPATRMYAVVGIGDAGPDAKEAVPALVAALEDEHEEIRALAIGALGQIGPAARAAIPPLEALARKGSTNAKRALEKIRAP